MQNVSKSIDLIKDVMKPRPELLENEEENLDTKINTGDFFNQMFQGMTIPKRKVDHKINKVEGSREHQEPYKREFVDLEIEPAFQDLESISDFSGSNSPKKTIYINTKSLYNLNPYLQSNPSKMRKLVSSACHSKVLQSTAGLSTTVARSKQNKTILTSNETLLGNATKSFVNSTTINSPKTKTSTVRLLD